VGKESLRNAFSRDAVAEEIAEMTVSRHLSSEDLIGVIAAATGVTVAESDDELESLTDDQVVEVWKHMKRWDEGQCSLCRNIIPAGDPRVFRAQDKIFCSEACALEAEEE
jgi:hypothetical protein